MLKSNNVTGMQVCNHKHLDFCEACVQGKSHKQPPGEHRPGGVRSNIPMTYFHMDIIIMPIKSVRKFTCMLLIVEDTSRTTFLFKMKAKNEVLKHFTAFIQSIVISYHKEHLT